MDYNLKEIYSWLEPQFKQIDNSLIEINELTVRITEIPAPPFKEANRAKFVKREFEKMGYDVRSDDEGNIYAAHSLTIDDPVVIVSAHLDTVFPDEKIKVVKEGNIYKAPGIGDDSRGLANLLFIAKLLYSIETKVPVHFIATVGEEGLGDLRGIKSVFSENKYSKDNVKTFITIDGTGLNRIVNKAVGSLRYELDFEGPGGHSYGSFGTVNPAYAAGRFMNFVGSLSVPNKPKTTYSIGTISGGTSINAIPEHVIIGIDIRSEQTKELNDTAEKILDFAKTAIEEENSKRDEELILNIKEVGNRPAGMLKDTKLEKIVKDIQEFFDLKVSFGASSTDANVPLNKGIPAIAVGSVKDAGRAHSKDEWIKADEDSLVAIKRNFLLIYVLSQY